MLIWCFLLLAPSFTLSLSLTRTQLIELILAVARDVYATWTPPREATTASGRCRNRTRNVCQILFYLIMIIKC